MTAIGILNTGSYVFHAIGDNRHQAVALALAAWRSHAEQRGVDPGYMSADDVNVIEGDAGATFRDLSPFQAVAAGHGTHEHADHVTHAKLPGSGRECLPVPMRCPDCLADMYFCTVTSTFHHVNPAIPPCFHITDQVI